MLTIKLDATGTKKIKWPATDIAVIKTAITLLEAEMELPDADCFPKLNLLRKMIDYAREETGYDDYLEGAEGVSESAALTKAKDFLRVIVAGLTYFHAHEIGKIEEWGMNVDKDKVYPPTNRDMIIESLQKYVQKELSLPVSARLSSPPLAQVQAAVKSLVLAREKREKAKNSKKGSPKIITQLFNVIQLAAVYHSVMLFDGIVDKRLKQFGFEVIDIPPKKSKVKKKPSEGTQKSQLPNEDTAKTAE